MHCAIRDPTAPYSYFGDAGRSADVADLFIEDGILEYSEEGEVRTYEGRTEIIAFLDEVKARWLEEAARSALTPRVFHSVGTHVIDVASADSASGRAYVWVVRSSGLAEWGNVRGPLRDSGRCVAVRPAISTPPGCRSGRFALNAAGFIATSTSGRSPGVRMS